MNLRHTSLCLLPLAGSLLAATAVGQHTVPSAAPRFTINPIDEPIAVDGRLLEPAWLRAARIPLRWEWFPGDNTQPPVETECLLTYDLGSLYLGCHARDPDPTAIRAHYADRDDLDRTPQDDHIVLLLDPFNDERRSFQFRVNAVGVQMDAFLSTAEGFEDFAWDAIWASAGRIVQDGYVVELAIPFRSLRFPETAGAQTWGVIIERSYPRSSRHRIRSIPTDRNDRCLLCQANKVTGFEGITPGSNVELYPTLTAGRTDTRDPFPGGDLVRGDIDWHPGLDVRWGITPNLSLNVTGNPDFSQVEADVAQLDVNTRFALYYPEKRPFFLEGADIFETPIGVVFTRTIADPLAGVKLSGKVGPGGVGFFTAYDRQTNLLFPANQGSSAGYLADSSVTTVARYRHDLGQSNYLGLVYAGRESFGDYHNRVAGADAFWQLTPSTALRLQALGSETAYPEATAVAAGQPTGTFRGSGVSAQLVHISRNWHGNLEYRDMSPEFRADAGFVPRVDQRTVEAGGQRVFWGGPDAWYTQIQAGASGEITLDYDGTVTDRRASVFGQYLGPRQLVLGSSANLRRTLVRGIDHELVGFAAAFQIRPSGAMTVGLHGSAGQEVDFTNNRTSGSVALGPSAQLSVGRPLTVSLSHLYQRLSFEGMEVFTANLLQARAYYHLDLRTLFRAIVQWQHVAYNPDAYGFAIAEQTRSASLQLLFSYKLNPQTVAFLGYAETHRGVDAVALTREGRTFFVKLGYALRP